MNIRKNMKTNTCIVVLIFTLLTVNVFAQNDYKWGEWTTWGDQEDEMCIRDRIYLPPFLTSLKK